METGTENNVNTTPTVTTTDTVSESTENENPLTNASNFEKFTLGIAFLATIFTILGMYIYKGIVDSNLVYLVTVEVSAFVARKGLKYHYEYGTNTTDSESPISSSKRKSLIKK
jgi:hypothetical protein